MERLGPAGEVRAEVLDAVLEAEVALASADLVHQPDVQAAVEVGQFAQAGLQDVVLEVGVLEDTLVGAELHTGAAFGGRRRLGVKLLRDRPADEGHGVPLPLAVHLDLEPFAQGVDDADAQTVQTAGDLVAAAAELPAGIEHGHHQLEGRATVELGVFMGDRSDGDASAVVDDGAASIGVEADEDRIAIAREGFVHGVVDHLVGEMVQTGRAYAADVHAGVLLHRLESFEDGDARFVVTLLGGHRVGHRHYLTCAKRSWSVALLLMAAKNPKIQVCRTTNPRAPFRRRPPRR